MKNEAEKSVSKFYSTVGWKAENGIADDTRRYEDLREHAQEYIRKCKLRVLRYIPDKGVNILDMGSGPIPYQEYVEYSKNFQKRYCIDLSSEALKQAKKKIGDHGVFLHGSFFDIPLEENFFDCAVSLHTIYHIDKNKQEDAIRKLLYVTKPGQPVIVVYSNPNTCYSLPLRLLKKIRSILENKNFLQKRPNIYTSRHPNKWWYRFGDSADVQFAPYQSFSVAIQKFLIPNNRIGRKLFAILFSLEERFPEFFVKQFQYPIIILTKRKVDKTTRRTVTRIR